MNALLQRAPMAFAAACIVGGCSESQKAEAPRELAERAPVESTSLQQGKRHVAVRNSLVVEAAADRVEAVLGATTAQCVAPDCEIVESSLTRTSRDAPPRANLRLRIAPTKAEALFVDLAKRADLIERRVQSEDLTDQVIDVEARLKNQTELRDRLRSLLGMRGTAVKDLVEVESQLARVQTELDSAAGRRKSLANETEKVAVAVEIRSRREIAESGVLAPITSAVHSAGHTFAQSVAGLIAFIVAVIPWMVLIVPAGLVWRRWRRARKTRT